MKLAAPCLCVLVMTVLSVGVKGQGLFGGLLGGGGGGLGGLLGGLAGGRGALGGGLGGGRGPTGRAFGRRGGQLVLIFPFLFII